jgi:membrane-associated protease RseP (regulator of RpoE activity)
MHMRGMRSLLLGPAAVAALLSAPFAGHAQAPALAASASAAAPGSFLRADDHRIVSIVYRLGIAGRPHCPETLPLTGLAFHHLAEYRPQDRPRAIAEYGVDRGMGVLSVVEGSPAAEAGLRAGDVLVSVNGDAFPSPTAIAAERNPDRWRPRVSGARPSRPLRSGQRLRRRPLCDYDDGVLGLLPG